jgi:hypothetical protein
MKSGHYIDASALYDDIEGLEILEVRELYHPRKLSRALRWCFLRRKLGSFKIGEINIYEMMIRNWAGSLFSLSSAQKTILGLRSICIG